jgi:hypothetical protein
MPESALNSPVFRRHLIAAACCAAAPLLGWLGWPLAFTGVFLLWRYGLFGKLPRLLLTVAALAPKLAVAVLSRLDSSGGMIFALQADTWKTSSSVWGWALVVAGAGLAAPLLVERGFSQPVTPGQRMGVRAACWLVAVVALGFAANNLLGLDRGFERVEAVAAPRWRLTHATWGVVAEFDPAEVAFIDANQHRPSGSRARTRWIVRIGLRGGREYSMTNPDFGIAGEIQKLAATMDLKPGTARVRWRDGRVWTNRGAPFNLRNVAGSYELPAKGPQSRVVLSFRSEKGRLMGSEARFEGAQPRIRPVDSCRLAETGEFECKAPNYFAASDKDGKFRFSMTYAPEVSGRFVSGGLETGVDRYVRR